MGDRLWRSVGREPSGSPFNSIVQLERELGIPRNPFINAGALVVTDAILAGRAPQVAVAEILSYLRGLPGKSGVAGGILAIAPRKASVAVWSPGLNEAGNSLVGALAMESLSRRAGWSVF